MDTAAYIESGILELYVFGLLNESENREVHTNALEHEEVAAEILSIEKAVINLSYAVSPKLSAANYDKIRAQLIEKHSNVIQMEPKHGTNPYIGWAAAIVLLFGLAFQYYKYNQATEQVRTVSAERSKYEQLLAASQKQNTEHEAALAVVRDTLNTSVKLAGQQVSPASYATAYVNETNKEVYIDLSGLPKPPEGKVYQVWALKLDPLTPTSIGVINDKEANSGVFKVDYYQGAQAFGVTLEPAGGSKAPTLEQLYALGKV